jgi:aryl-alcohol dehydrogenase-like predicted oxidoreductase
MAEKRAVGTSGLEVAPIALGGNVFGWTADENSSFAILDAFVDAGGTMIDTADVYSAWAPGNRGGESEIVIGRWLARNPAKRDKVVIATKVGFLGGQMVDGEYVAALEPEAIRSACDESLRRLGLETIDLYYQHKDNEAVPLADSLGAMDELVKAGKIRAIGLSQFTAPRVQEAMDVATADGMLKPCCLQTWYNMVEREKLEGPLRDAALANGLGIFPFYSLANGFLTGKYRSADDIDKSPRGSRNIAYLEGRGQRVLEALDAISAEIGAPLATVALAWTKDQPGIVAALASATNLDQLKEITAAMNLQLAPDQIERLSAASAETVPA